MDWQEAAVAAIVGTAVVSLYRHLRGIFAAPRSSAKASCHGCDDCESESEAGGQPAGAAHRAPPTWTGTVH